MVLLSVAALATALAAETVKVAPTQSVVDFLVSQGADSAAIDMARANAPSEALFLAPGAPSKEALTKIELIANAPALAADDPTVLALGYDPHDRLNNLVFSALAKRLPSADNDYTAYSMQIGSVIWVVSKTPPDVSPEDRAKGYGN
jgi:hypothetical protein